MQNLKLFAALGAIGLTAAVAAACGSSSSPASAPKDAGPEATVPVGDDSSTPESCMPLGGASGLCSDPTTTCCVDLSSGFSLTCLPPANCMSQIQIGCVDSTTCNGGVCCADFGDVDAGALAALEDGGLGALGLDASSLQSEAGIGSITSMLGNTTFKVACKTACTSTEIQACSTSAECKNGATCVPLSDLFPADASVPDGGLPAGISGSTISSLGMQMACLPSLDAGTMMMPEAGTTPDAAPEASVPEAGTDQ
jgi:hypothetical protein